MNIRNLGRTEQPERTVPCLGYAVLERPVLGKRIAHTHEHAAFNLTLDGDGVDHLAGIVRGIDLAHAAVIIQNDHMRGKAVADVALGVGNVSAQLVGRLQVHVAKLASLERLDGGRGILRMHTLAGDELLRAQLIGATVVVLNLDAVTMGAHRGGRRRLAGLDADHGIAQQEGGTAHGLAGHDRLTRARRGAGVGSVLGGALAVGNAAKRQTACLGNVLQKDGVAALADVGRGGIDHGHAVLDANLAAAGIGQAHAHAGVLHGAGNAGVSGMRIVGILDLEQRLLQRRGAIGNLAVGQNLARLDSVSVTNLPRIQADLLCQQVDQALERKLGLANAKAAVRAGGRVVGVVAKAANVGVLVLVGADGMRAGTLEHRAAQRRVGAGVKVDLAVQTGKVALGVAAQRKGAVHGVALGMERERLGAREFALHGTLELICGERGQVLDGHVLLAAKAAAHKHGLDDHALGLVVPAKHVGTLFARVVGTLVGRLHLDAVLVREGDGALGLQEGMLGKGRGKALRHGKRAFCQRLGGVAARHVTALAHVVLELHRVAKGKEAVVQARGVGSLGLDNVAHGLQRLVVNLYELLGLLERRLVLGNHQHDGVTHAAGDIALGDHDVPVLDKVADLVDRHVLGAQDAHHTGQGLGLGGVDGEHAGARILGAHGAGIGQARLIELVDVVGILALAEHLLAHVDTEGALAHAVGIACRCGRFLRGVERSLCAVVAQHREALSGFTARALLALNALLAARALRALRADGAGLAGQSLRPLLALRALRTGRANLAFLALRACLTLNALWASRAGFALFSLRSCVTGIALVSLGADFALRAGRGNARVGKSARRGVPLEPVARGLVDVGHLGNRRLRIRRRLQNLVDPALISCGRLGRAVCAQRRLDHRAPRPALGDRAAHGVGELGHALACLCGVGAAQRPDHVTVLALKARGIWRAVTLAQHRQREDTLAVQPRPTVRKAAPDDPLRLVLALMSQRQIRQLAHFNLSHTISYPLS